MTCGAVTVHENICYVAYFIKVMNMNKKLKLLQSKPNLSASMFHVILAFRWGQSTETWGGFEDTF